MLSEKEKEKLLLLLGSCIITSRNDLFSVLDFPNELEDIKKKIRRSAFLMDSIHNIPDQLLGKYNYTFNDTVRFLKIQINAHENTDKTDLSKFLLRDI